MAQHVSARIRGETRSGADAGSSPAVGKHEVSETSRAEAPSRRNVTSSPNPRGPYKFVFQWKNVRQYRKADVYVPVSSVSDAE